MIPFMKPKPVAGVIISKTMSPEGHMGEDDSKNEGLSAAAADLIRAIHAKDEAGVAEAFRNAFEILEAEPHDEYDDQNEQAAEGMED